VSTSHDLSPEKPISRPRGSQSVRPIFAQKTVRATASPSRDMDFSGEKTWLVEMHGHRLAAREREQMAVAWLASLLGHKARVLAAGCTAGICYQANKHLKVGNVFQMPCGSEC
jgi:hypothetical protein